MQTQRIAALEHHTTELQTLIRDGEDQYAQIVTTLKNANEALIEIRVRLGQSDIARRRDALQQEIERTSREAEAILTRRQQVIRDLHTEAKALEAALSENVFEDSEATRLQTHLALFRALHDSVPRELGSALDETQSVLQSALTRTQQELFGLEAQLKRLRERGDILERELTQLRKGGTTYSGTLERMRTQLTERLGSPPALLCEQLEVPDTRWQDAVEALLGARRFILLVPPTQFEAALQILDEASRQNQVYGVSLLDLERVQRDARPARAQSLALEISTQQPALRAYIDSVLGEVITCETPQELRQHRRAVTPQVMVYQEWTVRAIAPQDFRPWYVGARAQRSQIEAREQEQRELRNEFLALTPRQATRARQVKQLERIPQLAGLRVRLDAPLDDTLLRAQIAEAETELHALDLTGIAALEAEATRWQALIQAEESNKERVSRQNAKWYAEQVQVTTNMANARSLAVEYQIQLDQVGNANTVRFAAAQVLLAARLSQPDLPEARRNAEAAARGYDTRANNAQTALTELGTAYNTRYQFIGKAHDPDETSYAADQMRLAATDLPRYLAQIEQAQQDAEEELREHVLHRYVSKSKTPKRRCSKSTMPWRA